MQGRPRDHVHYQPEPIQQPQEEQAPLLPLILGSRVLFLALGLVAGGGAAWAMRPADPVKALETAPPVPAEARAAYVAPEVHVPIPSLPPVKPEVHTIEKTVERIIEKCPEPPKAPVKAKAPKPKPRSRPQPPKVLTTPWDGRADVVYAPIQRKRCVLGVFCD